MKKAFWLILVLFATGTISAYFFARNLVAAPISSTYQVNSSTDDVNQDGSSLTTDASTIWLGNGASTTSSYTGLRFNNVNIPQGATIKSAQIQVYSSQNQWITLSYNIYGDLSINSPTFSASSLPSQRTLTTASVTSSTNENWNSGTWYTLPDISSIVQEIVNQPGWISGNSLSIIMRGTGGSYARKFIDSYDGAPAYAVRLVITY
jgi:type IV pilus assembly protein PilY1